MCRRNFAASRHHDLTSLSNPITHSDTRRASTQRRLRPELYIKYYIMHRRRSLYPKQMSALSLCLDRFLQKSQPKSGNHLVPMFQCSTLFQCSNVPAVPLVPLFSTSGTNGTSGTVEHLAVRHDRNPLIRFS